MAIIVALSFVGTIFSFITPLLSKSLIDEVFIGGRTELVGYVLLGTIGSYMHFQSLSAYVSLVFNKKRKLDLFYFNDVSKETFITIPIWHSIKITQEMKNWRSTKSYRY
jgi:ATP-binding cassette subfamily B protein/subfamily B ATP-binding cassette protein MsbA